MAQIQIQNLDFTYDGDHNPVFQGLTLQLDTSWKLGLVGRNGRGKTTLLRLLEGSLTGRGKICCPERPLYFPRPARDPDRTAREVLLEHIPAGEEWRLLRELDRLGLGEAVLDRSFSSLSGGEQTRASLAALFLEETGWPMLDEPTDHLDQEGRALVARYLRGLGRGFLLVSHDRAFLDGCTDHTLALNPTGQELIQGNFSVWFRQKEDRDRREQAQNDKLKGEIRRLDQAARRAGAWSDRAEKSKFGAKNSGLRPDRGYLGHKSAKLMQRAKQLEARQRRAVEEKSALLHDLERVDPLTMSPLRYRGGALAELRDAAPCYQGRPVCRPCSLRLEEGQRLALAGGNGCGKTSLLRLLAGEGLEHTGTLRLASGLVISRVPQRTEALSGTLEQLARAREIDYTRLLTVLRKLGLGRELFPRDLREYSQGQKKKALLAASLCQSAHLYLWDEPLNYLDLFSRLQLEDLILQCRPTMIFVEHDQAFRQKIATETVTLSPAP